MNWYHTANMTWRIEAKYLTYVVWWGASTEYSTRRCRAYVYPTIHTMPKDGDLRMRLLGDWNVDLTKAMNECRRHARMSARISSAELAGIEARHPHEAMNATEWGIEMSAKYATATEVGSVSPHVRNLRRRNKKALVDGARKYVKGAA